MTPSPDMPARGPTTEGRATWKCDPAEGHGPLYYIALTERAQPPYRHQKHVEAILDIADDGTLAGVELIDDMPPPPVVAPASGMSAEPVAWQWRNKLGPEGFHHTAADKPEITTDQYEVRPLFTADSLTQELAAKDKEIEGLRAERDEAREAIQPPDEPIPEYFFDSRDADEPVQVRTLALKLAIQRGGQTCPVSDYDIKRARSIILGEKKVIDEFRARIADLEAQLTALRSLVTDIRTWAGSQCRAPADENVPCPLCGASGPNGEACKAVARIFPTKLLSRLNEAVKP